MRRLMTGVTVGLGLAACSPQDDGAGSLIIPHSETVIRDVHHDFMVLDSHLDTPIRFHTEGYTFGTGSSWAEDGSQLDLPRMNEGGLDGGFWVIFTPQGPLTPDAYIAARTTALMRQSAIREFAAKYSDEVELAFSADDAERSLAEGKKIVFQSMENAYPLGEDLSLLEAFYTGGLRMVGPVHFRHNQFADSATDVTPQFGGLSPLGEDLVREANRLGMILDGSHASDSAVRDMMARSTTPIILSHTGPKGVYDHPRNVSDALLFELAENGGVIQINAYGSYLERLEPSPERAAAVAELTEDYGTDLYALPAETAAIVRAKRDEINAAYPPPRSSYAVFLDHLLYTLDLIGPEHVGIGADWDGGGGVEGMEDVSDLPQITNDLLDAGYTEDDIALIWGGNMMRLMRAAEAARTSQIGSPKSVN